MANSVDPVLFSSILNSSLILGNYLQQTTSADYIFRCIFFLGALLLRVELIKFMLGKCFVIFCLQIFSTFFFQIFFQEWQTAWIQIRPDILSGLMWMPAVCRGYQQPTKFAASSQKVNVIILNP